MRAIAEWLLFREATTTELWILHRASDVAISVDEFDCSRDAD